MTGGALTLAYHGCDATTRDDLVSGRLAGLKPSNGSYDWLGTGSYFFEGDALRAQVFAEAAFQEPDKHYTRQPIATPAIVGAVLSVSRWLDMTTQAGQAQYVAAHQALELVAKADGLDMPENKPANDTDVDVLHRQLDQAVINMVHTLRAEDPVKNPPIQAVRGAFYQGQPLAPSSEFRSRTHVQIALLDPSCVVGWFLLPGNSLMTPAQYAAAKAALVAKKMQVTEKKPRVKPAK